MKPESTRLNGTGRPATRHHLGLCLLSLFLLLVWTGCERKAKVAVEINPTGNYILVSVGGKKVPCTLTHEGATGMIKSGAFTINGDGTCISKITFSTPSNGESSREVKATYTRQGTNLTMKWERAGITMGSIKGNAFTMDNEGMLFVYEK